ncbi:MAG: hypothetical protein R3C45_03975 [Phycisphaerales bacterium]
MQLLKPVVELGEANLDLMLTCQWKAFNVSYGQRDVRAAEPQSDRSIGVAFLIVSKRSMLMHDNSTKVSVLSSDADAWNTLIAFSAFPARK